MPYEPSAIANAFFDLAGMEQRKLTHMQVQKLVYFAHGWHLGYGHGPLSSEHPEAWTHGPVFPSLYHALKVWGGARIHAAIPNVNDIVDPNVIAHIRRTWVTYRSWGALGLSDLTHLSDGPWFTVRQATNGAYGASIPDDLIQRYFEGLIDANTAATASS